MKEKELILDDAVRLFRKFARKFGLVIPKKVAIGRFERCCPVNRSKKRGRYFFTFDGETATANLINPYSREYSTEWVLYSGQKARDFEAENFQQV